MKTNLTPEQQSKIDAINAAFDATENAINERREYRMKNYYDCVDDYSYGGVCDKADDMLESRARRVRDIQIEEVKNNGYHLEKTDNWRLTDLKGNPVEGAHGIRYGEYGMYFTTPNGYVGVPKKMSTLTKKGYKLERVKRTYKCVYNCMTSEGNIANSSMKIMSEDIIPYEDVKITDEVRNSMRMLEYSDYQYINNFC